MDAIKGSTYVIHCASPFYFTNETEEELMKPAVEGTLSVLKACTAHGVKRCVMTSSSGAISFGYGSDDPDRPDVFDESFWTKIDGPGVHAYFKSKTVAEKSAWDY